MIWIAKAVIQKTISFLPFKHRVNYLFQRYITRGVLLTDDLMADKLTHCKNHLEYFFKYGNRKESLVTLEIGTGWYPIVPIGFYLSGAAEVYTIDLSDLLKAEAIKETIVKFNDYYKQGLLQKYLTNIHKDRLEHLNTLVSSTLPARELLAKLNITSIVGDARKTDMPDAKFDLINSNNTFEHIYPKILVDILKEFKRLLKPDGIMSHQIDMSDHFAHLDKSITIYNFLKYSDSQWSLIDNDIQPQNRLRITDHRKLHATAGFKILDEINRPGSVQQVSKLKLAEKYNSDSKEQLAISHSLVISEKI